METSPIMVVLNLAASAALLIWAVRLVRTGFERAFGGGSGSGSSVRPATVSLPHLQVQRFNRTGATDKSRMLMVGDSLHTDILGAQAAGISSALIANYGFMQGRDIKAAINVSGICPNFVVQRP